MDDKNCPCIYCADKTITKAREMLGVVFDWLYYECKFDDTKTYTWMELMEIYLILRHMNSGKTLEEAQKLLIEDRKNG